MIDKGYLTVSQGAEELGISEEELHKNVLEGETDGWIKP